MRDLQYFKEQYARFKRWQHEPVKYVNTENVSYCNNCGLMFAGNYCPRCSQKADVGRISWKSVRNGIMDIWGLGTRSLVFSILQLLFRPGYFISDYISGKRQVSFPPVKMLFIVTVIYSLVVYWLFPQVFGIQLEDMSDEVKRSMNDFYQWSREYYSWAMLLMAVLSIFPTWLMFRYSPRNTFHSLPEGFFIQVLFSVLMVVLNFFLVFFSSFYPLAYSVAISLVTMFYYIVGYMQIFGYGLWSTLWREAFIMFFIIFMEFAIIYGAFNVDVTVIAHRELTPERRLLLKYGLAASFLIAAAVTLIVGFVINLIATRKRRMELAMNRSAVVQE